MIPANSRQTVTGPASIPVGPGSESETPQNLTLATGKNNELLVNLTVSGSSGSPSSLEFKFFTALELGSCMQQTNPSGCMVDETVSNQTVSIPLNSSRTSANGSGTYFFGFVNRDAASKVVVVSASLSTSSVETVIGRDGYLNFAALGLSVLGLLVAVYGVAARTVIPWE